MTTQDYANELLQEHAGNHWAAFNAALDGMVDCDRRTKQFKHYDRLSQWMVDNWPELGRIAQPIVDSLR